MKRANFPHRKLARRKRALNALGHTYRKQGGSTDVERAALVERCRVGERAAEALSRFADATQGPQS
ncbi:hypothetical protein [Hyphobacterium sp.]|uniref:hypothetical protein n=1 Tax=Hyphobacterium sp. TaxID=2004662 RepID=UPI003BABCBA7